MTVDGIEDVESFRRRARNWISTNLEPRSNRPQARLGIVQNEDDDLAAIARERDIQRQLFEAGLAGVCVSPEYGGQGLTRAHQQALNEELCGYEYPSRIQVPTFSPCASVLLEFGTDAQKRAHLPAILRGEELWMQLLSEPSGGSDVAAALTTAVRDGDEWVLNGSKIWTTGAWWSDWGLCLARTNWDVPKHRGLTVFILPLHQPGIEIHRIEMLNGDKEFCQEFLTDVRVPDSDRIGEVDEGWTVGVRWMFHERMLYNSPLVTRPPDSGQGGGVMRPVAQVARDSGLSEDRLVRDLVGEARMLEIVESRLLERISAGIRSGTMSDQSSAIGRLFHGVAAARTRTISCEVAGSAGAAWTNDDGEAAGAGIEFVMRQASCIGGGTTEMARNVISERVLGMPRERTPDRDTPFRDVPRSASAGSRRDN
ncbi:MAG TPA: acyl-CoA dehydrogenase family protein [Acidimicrobiales bacterium]